METNYYEGKLYAVEQILDGGLHTSDDAVAQFAMKLMDEIEEARKGDDVVLQEVIHDKETSIAYVVNFANKIFASAKLQIKEQKSAKSTAMALLASVNFYELLNLWPDEHQRLEDTEELSKKIKYAKYHAARILKALKNNEDPNEYVAPEEQVVESSNELVEAHEPSAIDEAPPNFVDDHEDGDEPALNLPSIPSSNPTAEFSLPEPPKDVPRHSSPPVNAPSLKSPRRSVEEQHEEVNVEEILESSEVYSKAQKHSKFAISAMNYEDTPTAIKELEEALRLLRTLE